MERYVLATSKVSINGVNSTWTAINKFPKHPRRMSSLGLELWDQEGDEEILLY